MRYLLPPIYRWCSRHFDLPLQAHQEKINFLANSPELLSAYPFVSAYLPSIPLHSIHSKFRHLHSIYWLCFLQKSTALHYHLLFFSTSCHFYLWQTESQDKKNMVCLFDLSATAVISFLSFEMFVDMKHLHWDTSSGHSLYTSTL